MPKNKKKNQQYRTKTKVRPAKTKQSNGQTDNLQKKNTQRKINDSEKVKKITDEIYTIIICQLANAKTKEEEQNIINTIINTYLTELVSYNKVKNENDLYKKYIEPFAKNILKNNEQQRKLQEKERILYYKLITAKNEQEEDKIKEEFYETFVKEIEFGIYDDTEETAKSLINTILSNKRNGRITIDKIEEDVIEITTKDEQDKILSKYFYNIKKDILYYDGAILFHYNNKNKIIQEEHYDKNNTKMAHFEYEYYEDNINLKCIIELDDKNEKLSEQMFIKGSETPETCVKYDPKTTFKTEEAHYYPNTKNIKLHIVYDKYGQVDCTQFNDTDGSSTLTDINIYYNNEDNTKTIIECEYNLDKDKQLKNNKYKKTEYIYKKYKYNVLLVHEIECIYERKEDKDILVQKTERKQTEDMETFVEEYKYNEYEKITQKCYKNNDNEIIITRSYDESNKGGYEYIFYNRVLVCILSFDENEKYTSVYLNSDKENSEDLKSLLESYKESIKEFENLSQEIEIQNI